MADEQGQILFVGDYIYALDSKDRVNIPARFRKLLPKEANDTFVITKGTERCLHLYPCNFWHQQVRRYWPVFNSNQEDFRKYTIWRNRHTREVQFDKQGRIQIPKVLLKYALLEKEVEIMGNNNRIELWNPDFCDNFVGDEDEKYQQMDSDLSSVYPQSGQQNPQPQNPQQPPPPVNPVWGYHPGYGYYPQPPPHPPGYYPNNPGQYPGTQQNSPGTAPGLDSGAPPAPQGPPPNAPGGFPPPPTDKDRKNS